MGGGGGGPVATGGAIGCGRIGPFATSISTGVENIEKMFRPLPVYSSDSACSISSGCSVGSRLAIDPGIFAASGAVFAGITLCLVAGVAVERGGAAGPVEPAGAVATAGAGAGLPPNISTIL